MIIWGKQRCKHGHCDIALPQTRRKSARRNATLRLGSGRSLLLGPSNAVGRCSTVNGRRRLGCDWKSGVCLTAAILHDGLDGGLFDEHIRIGGVHAEVKVRRVLLVVLGPWSGSSLIGRAENVRVSSAWWFQYTAGVLAAREADVKFSGTHGDGLVGLFADLECRT